MANLVAYRISFWANKARGRRVTWVRYGTGMESALAHAKKAILAEHPNAHGFLIRREHDHGTTTISNPRSHTMAKRKKTKARKIAIPKGKASGDRFKKGTATYVVVSYVAKKGPAKGKRVRFARRVKAKRATKRKSRR